MKARQYPSIKAWRVADELAVAVYEGTRGFPHAERYGLVSQMRRASVSVPANIAEGASRFSQKEYFQFLSIARASLEELRDYLHLAKRLGYLKVEDDGRLDCLRDEVGRVLYGLTKSVGSTTSKERNLEPAPTGV